MKAFITENGQLGDCEYCDTTDVPCLEDYELRPEFAELLSLYEPVEAGRHYIHELTSDPSEYGGPLGEVIQDDWGIFSEQLESPVQNSLIENIFNANSRPKEWEATDWYIAKDEAMTYRRWDSYWRSFSYHLTNQRRFIPDTDEPEIIDLRTMIQECLDLVDYALPAGQTTYRARRGTASGPSGYEVAPLPIEEMGAPPREKVVSGGRINPPGIAFLHLAFDQLTAAAEVRPHKGSILTVARLVSARDVRVADLTRVTPLKSPFGIEGLRYEIERRRLMRFLDREFARPTDPEKAAVEYVPTQYAAEVIRAAGYEGIVYRSSLSEGKNLVLFDPDAAHAETSELVDVTSVVYSIEAHQNREDL